MVSKFGYKIRASHTLTRALIKAALIGATVYGLYGFTLAGIFSSYGLGFAVTETAWGAILYLLSTYALIKLTSA